MISIISFAVVISSIAICYAIFPRGKQSRARKPGLIGSIRKFAYLLALLCFWVLVITSFYPVMVLKESIHGYWLVLHAVFAPIFAVCLAVLAVMWAGNCSFNENEKPPMQKLCFWLIVFLAIPVILSIVLSMFNFFGTTAQEFLLQLHRYSALVLALVIIVHTYLVTCTKREQ
jgi:thiosulfate reductase cytochrome b subunit